MAQNRSASQEIADAALALGFARVGFAPVEPLQRGADALREWLDADYHGEMAYLAAHGGREDARRILAEARTLIVVALPYGDASPEAPDNQPRGTIGRYAQGDDYHGVLKVKLRDLGKDCEQILGRPVLSRAAVDTAPLLEREAAATAGLGFIAKSTMLIAPGVGTYFVLGELLLDVDLEPGAPVKAGCGECTACLDACPTDAFVGPYVLDARRCISYLTIELGGPIPEDLRPLIGDKIFGCDICQDVCPFNASDKRAAPAPEFTPKPHLERPLLEDVLTLTSSGYRRFVKGTSLNRASRHQLARNAAVALGNAGDPTSLPVLRETAEGHPNAMVREHAQWAVDRIVSTGRKT